MTDSNEKIPFGEKLGLFGYGYKLCAKMTPSYIPLMIFQALLISAQPLVVLFFSARILDELSGGRDVQAIILYVSITVGATFLMSIIRAFLTREVETTARWEMLYQRIRMMKGERFAKMDFAHAEDSSISEILARMDTQMRGNGLGLLNVYSISPSIAQNLFSMIFAWMLLQGPFAMQIHGEVRWPVWALFGFFVVGIWFILRLQVRLQLMLSKIYKENAKANTAARFYNKYVGADEAAKDIRLYNQRDSLMGIFKSSFDLSQWIPYFYFMGRTNGVMLGLLAVLSGGYYLIAGYSALGGTATLGGIVQSVGAVTIFAMSIGSLIMSLGQLFNNAAFLKPMQEFLSLPDLLVKGNKPVPPPQEHQYKFEFRGVSFRYPGAEDYALRDLNLVFNVGKRLAVVGQNGSGKTTMIKLLCRLYDPTEGEILLDGINIKEYDYAEYTALFSVVFQDFCLFPFELGTNVAVGADYDKDRVENCLDGAGFSERRESMPSGLDTILYKKYDEDGIQVSGGEAQKIALARALYRDAPFVILDEPTAALDPIAEYDVYTTFDETIGDKTAVFISHRLSSCRFCHDIAVFEHGKLIQRGEHEELLAEEDGLYNKLWEAQAQHYVG
ncbi:MAG: ABC transporter ATP-binding protein/permease [Oscillospiraceae bacterium]|nr:ABC transporter ATP-binding protein/permease [Oscillospiraceae bacterium]MCL2278854.1 ABC transporter ATP-binding protein/permease [Oscillospiraceae bacterium]